MKYLKIFNLKHYGIIILISINCSSLLSQSINPLQKARQDADDLYSAKPVHSDFFTLDEFDPYNYEDIFLKGLEKMEQEDYKGAIVEFKKSIEVFDDSYLIPDDELVGSLKKDSRPENAIAYCYNQLNEYDSAIDFLNQGIENTPLSIETYNYLAFTYLLRADTHIVKYNIYIDEKNFKSAKIEKNKIAQYRDKAIETLVRSLKVDEENPKTLHSLAYIHYLKRDISETMKVLNYNLKLNPDYLRSYNLKAILVLSNGNIFRTNLIYDKAVNKNLSNPNAYYMRGIHLLKQNQLTNARNDFTRALSLEGDSVLGNFLIAFIDFRKGNTQTGLKYLMGLYKIIDYLEYSEDDKNDDFQTMVHKEIHRDASELLLSPQELLILGNYEKDRFLRDKEYSGYENKLLKKINHSDTSILWKKCLLLYQYAAEPSDIKLQMIDDILTKEPDSDFRILKGILFFENEKYEESITMFSKILLDQKNQKVPHFYMAHAYMEMGEFKKSIKEFDECLKLDSANEGVKVDKTLCYSRMGFPEKAIKDLRKYSKSFYRKSWIYESIGLIYMKQWEIDSGYYYLNNSLKANSSHPYPYVHKADYLFHMGSFAYAAKQYLEALDRDGNLIEALEGIADSYMNLGDYSKAKGYYSKCVKLNELNPRFRLKLAICFSRLNEKNKQAANQVKAKELISDSERLEMLKAKVYMDIGEFNYAVSKYQQEKEKNPNNEELAIELSKALYSLGKFEKSKNLVLNVNENSEFYLESRLIIGLNELNSKKYVVANQIFNDYSKSPLLNPDVKNEIKGMVFKLTFDDSFKIEAKKIIDRYF